MKRFLIILFTLICMWGIAHAQISAGACAGLNLTTVGGDSRTDVPDTKLGLNLGALVQYQLPVNLIFQSALLYSQKGYKNSYTIELFDDGGTPLGMITYDRLHNFNYVEIPLLVKFSIPVESTNYNIQPYLGSSIGYVVNGKYLVEYIGNTGNRSIKKNMNSTEVSLNIGIDVVYATNFLVGIQFEHGLTNIYRDAENNKIKNRVIMLNFGYLIPISQ